MSIQMSAVPVVRPVRVPTDRKSTALTRKRAERLETLRRKRVRLDKGRARLPPLLPLQGFPVSRPLLRGR